MKKSTKLMITSLVLAILACGSAIYLKMRPTYNTIEVKPQTSTVTFFFHGWGSSAKAEDFMARGLQKSGATKTIVVANVYPNLRVKFDRNFSSRDQNPVIKVNIIDNKLTHLRKGGQDYAKVYPASSRYVKAAILAVQKKVGRMPINLVGHSMGNLEIANYINENAGQKDFPVIKHLVAIAGHYNGIVGQQDRPNQVKVDQQGKPSIQRPEFKQLLTLRKRFPKSTRVLNIYGNVEDGSNSDGSVTNASSKSLKYLVGMRAKSYRELQIKGKDAQHSKLHHNVKVNDSIIKFLFK